MDGFPGCFQEMLPMILAPSVTSNLDHNFQDFVSTAGFLINGWKSRVFRKKNCLVRLFFAFRTHAKYGLVVADVVYYNFIVLQTGLEGVICS